MSLRRTIVPVALTAICLVAGWLSAPVFGDRIFAQQDGKAPVTMDKAFPNSNKCKRCHERVFEEWETSPLSRSIHSPAFRASLDAFLSSPAWNGANTSKVPYDSRHMKRRPIP